MNGGRASCRKTKIRRIPTVRTHPMLSQNESVQRARRSLHRSPNVFVFVHQEHVFVNFGHAARRFSLELF